MLGSSWAAMRPPWSAFGAKSEPRPSRKICPAIFVVQLGAVTEDLNRRWYEANTGQVITDVQTRMSGIPTLRWMAATLDGRVQGKRRGVRSQVHAAVVILGGGGGREIYAAAAAQHVGRRGAGPRCSPSSLAAANGSRSKLMPIRSISI